MLIAAMLIAVPPLQKSADRGAHGASADRGDRGGRSGDRVDRDRDHADRGSRSLPSSDMRDHSRSHSGDRGRTSWDSRHRSPDQRNSDQLQDDRDRENRRLVRGKQPLHWRADRRDSADRVFTGRGDRDHCRDDHDRARGDRARDLQPSGSSTYKRSRDDDSDDYEHRDKVHRSDRDRDDGWRSAEDFISESEDDVTTIAGDSEYVSYRALLAACRDFMGEDLPMVEPAPTKTKIVSAFRSEPETERPADHIPISQLIKSTMALSQGNFFGYMPMDITEQPSVPVPATDKSAGKLPPFKFRYYKTEDHLQSRPTQVQPDAASLWPDKKFDKSRYISTAPKVLSNIGAAAQRSLLAINYFEYFAAVQAKALKVLANRKSSPAEIAAATDLLAKISASMGRCLEDITKQQAYILTSATVVRREAVLQQRKLPLTVQAWLRAQPILTGQALFGQVSSVAKPLLVEDLARRTSEKIAAVIPRRDGGVYSKPKQQQQKRLDNRSSNNNRSGQSSSAPASHNNSRSDSKPNYRNDSKSGGGGPNRSQGKKKPFNQRGPKGQGKK
jgi:hypothetical protein